MGYSRGSNDTTSVNQSKPEEYAETPRIFQTYWAYPAKLPANAVLTERQLSVKEKNGNYPDTRLQDLSSTHAHMLFEESAISEDVAAERGSRTVRSRAELLDFKKYQRRAPALRVPMYSPDGVTTSAQIRPDRPRKDKRGKVIKYETIGGSEVIADVHPRNLDAIRDPSVELNIGEGIKKGDAGTSRGQCWLSLIGVWNFQRDGELLPCFDHIPLKGRRVNICYDHDVMVNPSVQLALQRLVEALEARGADVYVVYLPDLGDGKTGVDDFYAAGYTVAEYRRLARRYEPVDIGNIRLSRDGLLRAAIDSAWSAWWSNDWSRVVGTGDRPHWMRGYSCRDAEKVAIDTATKSGVVVDGGIYFSLDVRSWAEHATSNKDTVRKSIAHLISEGRLRLCEGKREEGKAAGYVLLTARATPVQKESKGEERRGDSLHNETSDRSVRDLRAPRLRWSAPTFERNADGGLDRGYIRRLGKHNGAIVDRLERGGATDVAELAELLNKRVRDLRRRNLPLLVERGIILLEGDTLSLVPDWTDALALEQYNTGELAAAENQRRKHREQREAYRNRDKTPVGTRYLAAAETVDPVTGEVRQVVVDDGFVAGGDVTEVDMDAARAERERRYEAERERSVSPLAEAMRAYLESNPHHADEPAGWIGSTLWAYSLYDGKPTPQESKAALAELGGDRFLERLTRGAVA
jgi:hypothetical protein